MDVKGKLAMVALVIQSTILVIAMRYSRTRVTDRNELYMVSTAVAVMEVMKLVACLGVLYFQAPSPSKVRNRKNYNYVALYIRTHPPPFFYFRVWLLKLLPLTKSFVRFLCCFLYRERFSVCKEAGYGSKEQPKGDTEAHGAFSSIYDPKQPALHSSFPP